MLAEDHDLLSESEYDSSVDLSEDELVSSPAMESSSDEEDQQPRPPRAALPRGCKTAEPYVDHRDPGDGGGDSDYADLGGSTVYLHGGESKGIPDTPLADHGDDNHLQHADDGE